MSAKNETSEATIIVSQLPSIIAVDFVRNAAVLSLAVVVGDDNDR